MQRLCCLVHRDISTGALMVHLSIMFHHSDKIKQLLRSVYFGLWFQYEPSWFLSPISVGFFYVEYHGGFAKLLTS